MVKILILTNNTDYGNGGGRLSADLISGVRAAGHDVSVREGNLSLLSAFSIRRDIKTCDLVHAIDGYPFGVIGALANLGLRKKLVITLVGTYSVASLYNAKLGWLLRWAYRSADAVTSISNYTKQEVLKKVELADIEVITPGIDLAKFQRDGNSDSSDRVPYILSVGALKYRKGYHISISAFAQAKKQIPDLRYKIVGDQSDVNYFQKLKQLARELQVENDVEFLTDLTDEKLSHLYQTAQLFLLTSVNHNHHFEGFGIVFLEASAAGLPCIGTSQNGIEDAMKDGENGFLVPQNDIEETARRIVEILSNPSQYQNFSRNSINWARQNSTQSSIAKYLEIYRKIS